jgi:hypothetical protein
MGLGFISWPSFGGCKSEEACDLRSRDPAEKPDSPICQSQLGRGKVARFLALAVLDFREVRSGPGVYSRVDYQF